MRRKSQFLDSHSIGALSSKGISQLKPKSTSNPKGTQKKFLSANPSYEENIDDTIKPLTTIKDEDEDISVSSRATKSSKKKKIIKASNFTRTFDLSDQSQNFKLPNLPSPFNKNDGQNKKVFYWLINIYSFKGRIFIKSIRKRRRIMKLSLLLL